MEIAMQPLLSPTLENRGGALRNGAEWLLDTLIECGVDTLFGYPGGAALPLYDALHGEPRLQAPNACCPDYSIAKGGQLVAYRWDGEQILSAAKLVRS